MGGSLVSQVLLAAPDLILTTLTEMAQQVERDTRDASREHQVIADVKAQIGILGSFNESGDSLPFTPGASAMAQLSKAQANIPFWDTTLR